MNTSKRTDYIRIFVPIASLLLGATLVVTAAFFRKYLAIVSVIVGGVLILLLLYTSYLYEMDRRERTIGVTRILGSDAKEAMVYGQLGIIIYDDDYVATWASELFDERGIDLIGEKITRTIPGSETLLSDDRDVAIFNINGRDYEITRSDTSRVLYVKDVTEYNQLLDRYNKEKVVIGLIRLDNYEETIQYEDEQKISLINSNIRKGIVDWAISYNSIIRRLRSDRFIVVINEENFSKMVADRFNILNQVKTEAVNLDVAISASMAFALGTEDYSELDNMANDLLELVLSRGGDQVAVKRYGEEVQFYGSSSESGEKNSKVRVRVIAQTLKGILNESDNVFIVPHKTADFDAIGACLGMSVFCQGFGKQTYIIMNNIDIEASALAALNENAEQIDARHNVISEQQAFDLLTKNSTVILCDHHSADLTAAEELVKRVKRIVIIDHHRRKQETNINAMLIYNEPASSSTVELVSELIEYQPTRIELNDFEATYMYTGILVDTDGFKSRCSSRSFEVCAYLKREGADIALANEWLKDSLEEFEIKNKVLNNAESINGNILVAALPEEEGTLSRTMVAQVANHALSIKKIDAAFVIAKIEDNTWALSGRSNGTINVQIILEKMGGGGHFAAAGLQRQNSSVKILHDELIEQINEYLAGGTSNEGNTTE